MAAAQVCLFSLHSKQHCVPCESLLLRFQNVTCQEAPPGCHSSRRRILSCEIHLGCRPVLASTTWQSAGPPMHLLPAAGQHCTVQGGMGTFSADAATFSTGCACLTQNTECDQQCACHATGQCKNCAVSERRVLLLGTDVQEVGAACPRPCGHVHAAAARLLRLLPGHDRLWQLPAADSDMSGLSRQGAQRGRPACSSMQTSTCSSDNGVTPRVCVAAF